MVKVNEGMASKSTVSVAVLPAILTLTGVAPTLVPSLNFAVTLTVCAPPFSLTLVGETSRVKLFAGGS